ncbi:MAG: HNH endonuclease, partial [Acidimicrobiia bacterium]|nr:HNH endonuclease [Acidimicrobiia bacterium]
PALRKALELRDQHCTHPGCQIPARWCDAHHVVHWADGGTTDLSNLRLLCRQHHRHAHHHQPYPKRQ